jgi:hypothetical protein
LLGDAAALLRAALTFRQEILVVATPPDPQSAKATPLAHEVRGSLIEASRTYVISEDRLSWRDATASGAMLFEDIRTVHLLGYPSAGGQHLQCTLTDRFGGKLKLRSHHYVSLGSFESRAASYGPLVRAVVERAAGAGDRTQFRQGGMLAKTIGSIGFYASLVMLVLALLGQLSGRSSTPAMGPFLTLLALLPLCWFLMRQKTGTFDPNNPPADLLGS